MRWNASVTSGSFDGQVAAVPVTLLSREEDVHHPMSVINRPHAATRQPIVPSKAAGQRLPKHRHPTIASLSETIHLGSTVAPFALDKPPPNATTRVLTPRTEDPPVIEATNDTQPKFLVCAGRAMNTESPRSNNDDDDVIKTPNFPVPMEPIEVPRPPPPRGLQRSDSELELIISELREKIALQQRSDLVPHWDDDGNHLNPMRKHLKNPIEKMSLASSSLSSTAYLRRQTSASQMHATRLVRERSATMVTPVVLSASVSRSTLCTGTGGVVSHLSSALCPTHETPEASTVKCSEPTDAAEGFRIRAYATGTEHSHSPALLSSTSLGLKSSATVPSPPCVRGTEPPMHLNLLHPTKPRVQTLTDMNLDLDRLYGPEDDAMEAGSLSPVGPWVLDHDTTNDPMTSSRSTASLTPTASLGELVVPTSDTAELSPRSRLLWLSDCCSDDGWVTPSVRVLAMLRPGCMNQNQRQSRPASATEHKRRHRKAKLIATSGKTRVSSAKVIPKRPSCEPMHESITKPKTPVRMAQRPRSGSTSSNNDRALIAQRASFRA